MRLFKSKVDRNYKKSELEFEDIFLDSIVKKQKTENRIAGRKLELPLKNRTFYLFFLFSLFILILILGITFNFQIIKHKKYDVLAQANNFITMNIQAERGVIYDRNMTQLVFNDVRFDIFIDKDELFQEENKDEILQKISEILNKDLIEINEKTQDNNENLIRIAQNISHKTLILIETKKDELLGIKIKKRIKREYLTEAGLSHILGYMGEISNQDFERFSKNYEMGDYVGKEGVEKWYQDILAEKKGVFEIERDVFETEISRTLKQDPGSGDSLILSLDFNLQQKLFQTLDKVKKEVGGKAAAAVILDPRNGEILASVSLPSFDNNLFARGISEQELQVLNQDKRTPQLNRVIGGVYPTGSTIKPFLGVAALEEGIITENTTLYAPEQLCLEHKYTKEKECFLDWVFHGWTDIKKAIAESVNPFFYMIGGGYVAPDFADSRLPKNFTGLGVEKIKEYLQLFGWGEKSGIDLSGEMKGRVPSPEWKNNYFVTPEQQKWYLGDTYNLSIGQGYLLATPLQVAFAFGVFANNGTLFQPRILKAVFDSQNNETKDKESVIKRDNFLSSENLLIINQGMRKAVSSPSGSAFYLSSLSVSAAAKTGTAQTSKKEVYHNWITVFAPYENPEIVLTVIVEDVEGLRTAAQKVAYEVLEWYFSQSNE